MKAYFPNVKWYYISSGDVKVDKTGHITIPDNTFDLHKDCTLDIKVEKSGYKTNHTLTEVVIYGTNGDSIEASLDGKHLDKASHYMKGPMLVFKNNIDLNSKTIGQKWTLKWKSIKTNLCNVL